MPPSVCGVGKTCGPGDGVVGRPAPNAGDGVVGSPVAQRAGVSVRCRRLNNRPREHLLRAAKDGLHPMSVRVFRDRLGPPGDRDSFANRLALQVERQLIEQVVVVAIGRQVHAVPEQLAQAVFVQVIGHEQRPQATASKTRMLTSLRMLRLNAMRAAE